MLHLLISLAGVIVLVATYLRWSRTNKEDRRLRNIKLMDETITLNTELLMLQHEIQNKLSDDFLEELKTNMDEGTFAFMVAKLKWLNLEEKVNLTARTVLSALQSGSGRHARDGEPRH